MLFLRRSALNAQFLMSPCTARALGLSPVYPQAAFCRPPSTPLCVQSDTTFKGLSLPHLYLHFPHGPSPVCPSSPQPRGRHLRKWRDPGCSS